MEVAGGALKAGEGWSMVEGRVSITPAELDSSLPQGGDCFMGFTSGLDLVEGVSL